jgi:ribose/xylose/arabinose/galactoside ABC-type transport system permease subunit
MIERSLSRLRRESTENGIEMDVIATVVMGGTGFSGGIGKLSGTILGMLLKGLVILLAGVVNSYSKG